MDDYRAWSLSENHEDLGLVQYQGLNVCIGDRERIWHWDNVRLIVHDEFYDEFDCIEWHDEETGQVTIFSAEDNPHLFDQLEASNFPVYQFPIPGPELIDWWLSYQQAIGQATIEIFLASQADN